MEIERQMCGVKRYMASFQVCRSSGLQFPVLLRPPLDAMVNNEEIDTELFSFLKSGDTGINGKTDLPYVTALTGHHLQAVHRSVFDLSDPKRLVQ
jgi:hypothetical protein